MIDGKMLGRADEHFAKVAKRLGVRPLMEFFSISAGEADSLLGDDMAGQEMPPVEWFTAEEGLKTIDALLTQVDSAPEALAAKQDLLDFQRVLREAQKQGVKWRLAMDT